MKRNMKKKGQAALEFLTTYGWAFLIILVMMGAISYFGFTNPSTLLPDKCAFGTEFSCEDHQITASDGKVKFKLKENIQKSIIMGNATCQIEGETSKVTDSSHNGKTWNAKDTLEFVCDYGAGKFLKGERVKVKITMQYQKIPNGFLHETDGEIYTKVVE